MLGGSQQDAESGTIPKSGPRCRRFALLSSIAISLLAACATPAQQTARAIVANNHEATLQLKACSAAVYESPGYEKLRSHLPENINDATIEQMTDTSFATGEEIKAIIAVHPQSHACAETFLNQVARATPSMVPIFAGFMTENENSLLDLVRKKISWGEYVVAVKDRLPGVEAKISAESQRIAAGLNQENQAELAQRQAAANALVQWAQNQELLDTLNRPVTTTCSQFGQMTNCVSQ